MRILRSNLSFMFPAPHNKYKKIGCNRDDTKDGCGRVNFFLFLFNLWILKKYLIGPFILKITNLLHLHFEICV